jgi:hypothetical protein
VNTADDLDASIKYLYARLLGHTINGQDVSICCGSLTANKSTVDELLQRWNEFEARYGNDV